MEKRKFENLLGMSSGYVLDFSNRTFDEFVLDSIGRSIYDPRYSYGSGSKANQLRGLWKVEENFIVAKLMGDLLDLVAETHAPEIKDGELFKNCRTIVARLNKSKPVADLHAIASLGDDKDFEAVANAVRNAIEENRPEAGLDRLHTFTTKYLRSICELRGVTVTRDKPLHSLIGEYIKRLKELGYIESEMTLRILKTSISNLEAFNDVRNNQSLAHDNPMLNYDEALLIFNNIASCIRFIRSLEERIEKEKKAATDGSWSGITDDDIPF
jgi:hypothetical protein